MLMIKKNDTVSIISGKDKGKSGKVMRVFKTNDKALVERMNISKKAQRRTQQNQQGGFVELEMPIHLSNLMLICKQCNKPTRFKISVLKDGTKIRECKKCKAAL